MRNTLAVLLPKEKPMQIIVSAAMLRDLEILALTGLFGGSPEAAARRIIEQWLISNQSFIRNQRQPE